jgi:hypothetical protein
MSIPDPSELRKMTVESHLNPNDDIIQMMKDAAKNGEYRLELRDISRKESTAQLMEQLKAAGYKIEWHGRSKTTEDWVIYW